MGKGLDWCRIVMNQETRNLISNLDVANMDALEIWGRSWKKIPWKSYVTKHYPEFNLCIDPKEESLYDIILSEQVFEHIQFPYKGIRTVWKLLKPGGYFLSTTPLLLKVHGSPNDADFWRWTPKGKQLFFEDARFEVITVGSWGNKECVKAYLNFETLPPYDPDTCPLHNEPDSPIMVWILGRKNV